MSLYGTAQRTVMCTCAIVHKEKLRIGRLEHVTPAVPTSLCQWKVAFYFDLACSEFQNRVPSSEIRYKSKIR
ncbi:hypothetical protein TNCV_103361 [Trichonephila clavipes]|nr:hypothetical protein TNCV_103361 [Trichonephila clavipes]